MTSITRSKEWWMDQARREGDDSVEAGPMSREDALEMVLRERGYHGPGECPHLDAEGRLMRSYSRAQDGSGPCMMEVAALASPPPHDPKEEA